MKLRDALESAARKCLQDAIDKACGNVTAAAKAIGVNRTHFYRIANGVGLHVTQRERKDSQTRSWQAYMAHWKRVSDREAA